VALAPRLVLLAAAALAGLAGAAVAYVPPADRVLGAAAETNTAAGRAQALQLELVLRLGGGTVGRGELVTHPQGLARLELRGAGELVERHILQGSEHRASRNGRLLEEPRAFLPPLFLLQADSAVTLRAALRSYGVDVDQVGVAPCGSSDCFVVGDPALAAPRPGPHGGAPPEGGEALAREGALGSAPEDLLLDSREDEREPPRRARVWLETESLELRRIDLAGGARVRLGPPVAHDSLRFPAWFQVEEPGRRPARFEVRSAVAVTAPPSAFGRDWLLQEPREPAPETGPENPGGPPPEASGAPSR